MNNIAIASQVDIDTTHRIWCPPTGRPYWVLSNKPNAGPELTDREILLVNWGLKKRES